MGTQGNSEALVLPKIANSSFLVAQDPEEEEEEERQRKSIAPRNQRNNTGDNSFSKGSSNRLWSGDNGSFVPKTLTSGSAPRPTGEARQFAERRIQHEEIMRDPRSKRLTGQPRPVPKTSNAADLSPSDDEVDSTDSGIASADKTATADEKPRENSEKQTPERSDRQKPKVRREASNSPAKQQTQTSEPPPLQRNQSLLVRDDSGISAHTDLTAPPQGKVLVYDKHGNLILRDRQVHTGMSDPMPRKAPKLDEQLRRIYFSNVVKTKEKETKPPKNNERREVVLSRREADIWDQIHDVYGERIEKGRKQRHHQFMTRLELLQLEQVKRHNQQIIDKNLRALEAQKRQQEQLWQVRSRFDEEQRQRFFNQWVTTKSLQHERCDRHLYGLPEGVYGEPEHQPMLKRKKEKLVEKFDFLEQRRKNAKKFRHYLNVRTGGNFNTRQKMPKVEPPSNLDVGVKTHSGKTWKSDEKKVKDIIKEAKRELKAADSDSPRTEKKSKEETAKKRPEPKSGRQDPPTAAKSAPRQGEVLETQNRKSASQAAPKQSKPKPKPKPKPPSKRFQQVSTGAFQIRGRGPRKQLRSVGSESSLRTVDFVSDPADDEGLDAFERARIKYNLTMDSDGDSVA